MLNEFSIRSLSLSSWDSKLGQGHCEKGRTRGTKGGGGGILLVMIFAPKCVAVRELAPATFFLIMSLESHFSRQIRLSLSDLQ